MPNPTWRIYPKGARDVEPVVRLLSEVAREGRWIATEWPFDLAERAQAMREAMLRRWIVGWCAVDGTTLVGDLTLHQVTREEPEIGMMVAASHRGRGIGRALIESAVTWARANDKPALRLRVFADNAPARSLYRATGFVEVDVHRNAIGRSDGSALDAIVMRLPVSSVSAPL